MIIESYDGVEPNCDHMPGPDRDPEQGRLRVTVSGTFVKGGCSATLTEHEGNQGTGRVLKLDLNLKAPDDDTGTIQVLTPFSVSWPPEGEEPAIGLEYSDVAFEVVGT